MRKNMRAVLQRVSEARVEVQGNVTGEIGHGLLVLLGVRHEDTRADAEYLVRKVVGLRVFSDEAGKMNRNISDAEGALLVVSQFTLYGDCRRGMRPSFDQAARPEQAMELYEAFVTLARAQNIRVETGVFQADMRVSLVNEGPVTIIIDSGKLTSSE
jgi:D-aminoacyl-tRNA deacylase